jgi:hypothetical protein
MNDDDFFWNIFVKVLEVELDVPLVFDLLKKVQQLCVVTSTKKMRRKLQSHLEVS